MVGVVDVPLAGDRSDSFADHVAEAEAEAHVEAEAEALCHGLAQQFPVGY